MSIETNDLRDSAVASLEVTAFANAVRMTSFSDWSDEWELDWQASFKSNLEDAQALSAQWLDDRPDAADDGSFDFTDPSGRFLRDAGFERKSLRYRLQGMLTNIWSWAITYDTYVNGAERSDGTRGGGLLQLVEAINGDDPAEAAKARKNFNIGIGRVRLQAQGHRQTAMEAVEELAEFYESLQRVSAAFDADYRVVTSGLSDSDAQILTLNTELLQAENARIEAQRAHLRAGIETAMGVFGFVGGVAAVFGGIALLCTPEPTGATKVAGWAAIVGGVSVGAGGIATIAAGAIGVENAKAAEAEAVRVKETLDSALGQAQLLSAAMTFLQSNISNLRDACEQGLRGARALLSGWENLDQRLGSLQLSSLQVEPDPAALKLLENEWKALKEKTESLRELHEIPVETVEGIPGTEPQAA